MKLFKKCAASIAVVATLVMAWGLAGCSTDNEPSSGIPDDEVAIDDSEGVTLGFTVDNMMYGSMAPTRADEEVGDTDEDGHPATSAEDHERSLNHVYFLFFDKNNRFVTVQRTSVKAGDTKITFPVPSSLQTLTDYSVLMVANADYYPPVGYATFPAFIRANTTGKTITQVKDLLVLGVDHTMTKDADQYLPMEGKLVNEEGNEIKFNYDVVNGRYVANGSIVFKRQVVRVDLNNYAAADLDIKWVKICNYRNTDYVCKDYYTGGTVQPGINDDAPELQTPHYIKVDPAEDDGSGFASQKVRASLYAFPNSVAKPSQDDAVTTYLMIAAVYRGSTSVTRAEGDDTGNADAGDSENSGDTGTPDDVGGQTEKLCYYRFNLNRGSEAQYLEKNHIYTANIMGVKGPGADTESAARLTDAPVLIASVEETWDDDATNSDADAAGNFLIVSKTNISFQGDADQTQKVSVKIREGMTWKYEAVNNTGNSNSDFSVTADNANGELVFRTLTRNNTNFVKYGYFKISGLTPDGKVLSLMVFLQQLSVNDDVKMLTVNGQTGTLEPKVSGTGTTFLFQVQTGSTTQGWTCEQSADGLNWPGQGVAFTRAGGNKGFLEISVPANISGQEREVTLVVKRQGVTEEEVKPVKIHIKQPKSKVLLSVFPYPQNGVLELEGFLNEIRQVNINTNEERTNSFSVQKDVFVTLADPVKYQYKVECNFDGYRDMRLSANSALLRTAANRMSHPNLANSAVYQNNMGVGQTGSQTFQLNQTYQILDHMSNGEKFYLNVYRTGPGDPDIVGTIKITAYPKDGQTGETQTISFDIRIISSCEIADVVLYYGSQAYLVADRNVGAVPRLNGTTYTRALDYSNYPYLKITNTDTRTDGDNKLYSGGYFTAGDMWLASGNTYVNGFREWVNVEFLNPNKDINQLTSPFYTNDDVNKWTVPTYDYMHQIWYQLQWSKKRPYLVSSLKHNGKFMGCYLPVGGADSNTSTDATGYYWSSNGTNNAANGNYYRKIVSPEGYYWTSNQAWNYGDNVTRNANYLVRCMRLLSAAEVTKYNTWLTTH